MKTVKTRRRKEYCKKASESTKSVVKYELSWMKAKIQTNPAAAFSAAGLPLRGILRFFRVAGTLDGSVPGGTSKSVVSIQRR